MFKNIIYILQFVVLSNVIIYAQVNGQSLQFTRERIEIKIQDNNCCVMGKYYFTNNTSRVIQHMMYYPFVVNQSLPFPDSMLVDDEGTNSIVPFRKSENGILFSIAISPMASKIYKVTYYQRTPDNFMEYILTTTRQWGQPLDIGEYIVDMPNKYKMKYLSMKIDSVKNNSGYTSYILNREHFMPEKNLTIKWER